MDQDFFYIVFQTWMDANGTPGVQGFVFKDEDGQKPAEDRAKSQYHNLLAGGAVSNDQYFAACVFRSDGSAEMPFEFYDRRPKPEETEE